MELEREHLAALAPNERAALAVARFVNETPRVKAAAQWINEAVAARWMTLVSKRRIRLVGMEKMAALAPKRGVLIAANHRSFFDMYMVATYLHRHTDWCRRLFFPVRSHFFYERPLGVVVNALASSMAMYPPIFRANEKRDVTRAGLDFLARELAVPGTVVGIHPEGTRSKSDDAYDLLPPEQGFGRVALQGRPVVVPVFVNGMTNALARECLSTFDGTGIPIFLVFGDPVDLGEFADVDPQRLRAQIAVGRKVMDAIAALGARERRLRAALAEGKTLEQALADEPA